MMALTPEHDPTTLFRVRARLDAPAAVVTEDAPDATSPPSARPRARSGRTSNAWALTRLVRASWTFGVILASYLTQRGLVRVLGERRMARRWTRVHVRNAKRLYRGCVRMRGVYIKMGQVLSTMGTFLPAAYAKELEALQDDVPPRRFADIAKAVEGALGKHPDRAFFRFERDPVAAASLGQVHRAWTHAGEAVAVKVLYPDVDAIMRVDMKVIRWAMQVYRWFMPIGQLKRFLDQLEEMLARETDLAHEAACIKRMADDFSGDDDVLLPTVFDDLSTPTVLTMSFMNGVKVSDRSALGRLGLEPSRVARKLIDIFYQQLFVHGFFHADPHPGNFFAQRGPAGEVRIVILDLGSATPTLDPLVRGMMDVLGGFMSRDDALVMRGIEGMGFVAAGGDRALLEQTVKRYFEKLLNVDISDFGAIDLDQAADLIDPGLKRRELRRLMRSIEYPEGWFYVERAAIILMGLSTQMAPTLNPFQVGFPYIARYLATQRSRA